MHLNRWTREHYRRRRAGWEASTPAGLAIPRSTLGAWVGTRTTANVRHVLPCADSRPVSTSNRTFRFTPARTNPPPMVRVHSGSPSMPVCVTGYTASTRVPMRRPCSEQSRDSGCSLQVRTRVLLRQPVDTASVPRASLRAQSAHRPRAQERTLSLDYIA